MLFTLGGPAFSAEMDPFDDIDRVGGHEVWTGIDVFQRAWFSYAGVTVAPWGDTHTDGWRLRATAGAGHYSFLVGGRSSGDRKIDHEKATGELLAGYQTQLDALTIKMFAGWAMLARRQRGASIEPRMDQGVKIAAELWFDWSEATFASVDVAYADTRSAFDARLRVGQRVESNVTAGIEAIFNRLDVTDEAPSAPSTEAIALGTARGGVFVRYDWFGGEASLSGGIAFDATASPLGEPTRPTDISGYGAAVLLFQF